jgi:hypothetical protein
LERLGFALVGETGGNWQFARPAPSHG